MAGDIASYIFGGTSGIPSYDELLRRRQIATANAMRQKKMPTTLGEGMTYLGEAVGDRLESNRLTEAERAFATSEDARLTAARTAAAGGGSVPPRVGVPASGAVGGSRRVPTERIAPDAVPAGAVPGGGAILNPTLSEGDVDPKDRIALALMTSPQEVAQMDPTLGAATPPGSQSDDPIWNARTNAIGGIESSNDYQAVGVPTKYGRAMGRYGVIEANVGPWTKEALGQPLTPQQFLADPQAQDAVFKHRFGQYVAKYGEEKAARAWYGGEGNINNLNATDAHEKLSVHDYGRDYINRLRKERRTSSEDDGAAAPIQLAALGGAGGTMTDAPPPGAGARPMPGVEPEPDPTVTGDIRPTVAPNMMAQVGPEMFSPRRMSDTPPVLGAPARPPAAAPGAAVRPPADLPPSLTPVPAASRPPDPGAPPKPPERLDELPGQRAWMDVINNRNASPYAKEYAQNQYNILEKRRTETNALREADYRDLRELWQKKKEAFDNPSYDIEDLNKRLAAQKVQRDLVVMAPLEERIKKAEGDLKQAEVDGIPDAIAKRKAELLKANVDYSIAVRTLNKPDTVTVGGTHMERPYDPNLPPGEQPGKFAVPPGLPQPKDPLTEKQGSTIKFLQRATIASSQLGDAAVLAGLKDTASGKVPIGGNYLVSPEYQRARSAAFTWGQAVLRDESGAVLGAGEIANKLHAYFPEPGDSEQVIRDKAFRRKAEEESLYHSLGDAKPQIDKWREERKARKAIDPATNSPLPEGTMRINNRTGVKQRVMGGHWESEEDLR